MTNLKKDELIIIKSIQMLETPTRQLISENVNLSVQKVSVILKSLEKKKIIRKNGKSFSSSGRPSYLYEVNPLQMYTIGASINNQNMTIVIIDAIKEIVSTETIMFSKEALSGKDISIYIEEIITPLKKAKEKLEQENKIPVAIGISLPGMIDTARRVWLSGLQLPGVNNLDINKEICKRLDMPVYVEDNSRIISYYEKTVGHGKNINDFVVLYLGIGVGAGIIINNTIYRGAHGTAGEIGHLIQAHNNYRCSCGNVGCLETVTSQSGVVRMFQDRLSEGVYSILQQYRGRDDLTIEAILDAADKGDKLARNTLFEIGQFIGDACVTLIDLFNPEKVFITGPLEIFKDYFSDAVKLSLTRKVFPTILKQTQIQFTPYSYENEALGAALFSISQYWDDLLTHEALEVDSDCD